MAIRNAIIVRDNIGEVVIVGFLGHAEEKLTKKNGPGLQSSQEQPEDPFEDHFEGRCNIPLPARP